MVTPTGNGFHVVQRSNGEVARVCEVDEPLFRCPKNDRFPRSPVVWISVTVVLCWSEGARSERPGYSVQSVGTVCVQHR